LWDFWELILNEFFVKKKKKKKRKKRINMMRKEREVEISDRHSVEIFIL
jgi:hypothetical protein